MLLLMVLHPLLETLGYPISSFLEEHGIEGPTFFAMLAVLCGFLFWWALYSRCGRILLAEVPASSSTSLGGRRKPRFI
jgi:hypothetical protein